MKIKIAYLLLVHKDPVQVNLFIRQILQYGDADIYIHLDTKNKKIAGSILTDERVKIFSRYDVRWGSFAIVQAGIFLMDRALHSGADYSHIYFGSGQDLIVRKGLYEYLQAYPEKIFIRISKKVTDADRAAARYLIAWPGWLMVRNDYHVYRLIRIVMQVLCACHVNIRPSARKLQHPVTMYEGRTWFICPVKAAAFILDYINANQDFVSYWKDSLASDLMFFQTIIMNSGYAPDVEDELMYVRFGKTFGTMNHPVIISRKDLKEIRQGNYFFARKFDYHTDRDLIRYFVRLTKRTGEKQTGGKRKEIRSCT